MTSSTPVSARLAELLADEAANSIDREGQAQLDELLGRTAVPDRDRDRMMTAASLAQLAFLKNDPGAQVTLPGSLRRQLAQQAEAWNAGRRASPPTPVADLDAARRRRQKQAGTARDLPPPERRIPAAAGWYAAAALAVVFIAGRLVPDAAIAPIDVSPQARRIALVSEATDVITVPWGASAEPGYENARGDVVWSDARQEGYLRISGLPINERAHVQYQLWVVDASRDVHPVDGGVFDITTGGELIIPVQARLALNRPTAFAVTLEKPGGVVVSDGPMLLVAAVGT